MMYYLALELERGKHQVEQMTIWSSDEDIFCSDLDLEELTNEVDGLETLAKEMEVNTNRLF